MTSVGFEVVTFWLSKHAIVVITRSMLSPPGVAWWKFIFSAVLLVFLSFPVFLFSDVSDIYRFLFGSVPPCWFLFRDGEHSASSQYILMFSHANYDVYWSWVMFRWCPQGCCPNLSCSIFILVRKILSPLLSLRNRRSHWTSNLMMRKWPKTKKSVVFKLYS